MMSYQIDQTSAAQLIKDGQQEGFLSEWSVLRNRALLLRKYKFTDKFLRRLLKENITSWEELLTVISKIMKAVYPNDEKRNDLGEFRYQLLGKGFSQPFVETFDRLAYKKIGRKDDLMVLHFSRDLSLRDLVALEDAINKYYVNAIDLNPTMRNSDLTGTKIVKTRAFSHPGSVEIFITLAIAIALPIVIGLSSILWSGVTAVIESRRNYPARSIITRYKNQPYLMPEQQSISSANALAEHFMIITDEHNIKSVNQKKLKQPQELIEIEKSKFDQAVRESKINPPLPEGLLNFVEEATKDEKEYIVAKSSNYITGLES